MKLIRLIFITLCCWIVLSASASEPAGTVLLAIGKNQAIDHQGKSRALKRQSLLFPGDQIETAARGRIQLRMSDGSLVSLKANTHFSIDEYQFSAQAPNDGKAVYKLLKGGMRTVTGLIGREQKEDYRLETPVATIGIRGTHFSLFLCDAACAQTTQQPAGLFGGVTQGGIQIENRSGGYPVGPADFFHIADQSTPLTPLESPPPLLDESMDESQSANDDSASSGSDDTDATSDDENADSEASEEAVSDKTGEEVPPSDQQEDTTATEPEASTDNTAPDETATAETTTDLQTSDSLSGFAVSSNEAVALDSTETTFVVIASEIPATDANLNQPADTLIEQASGSAAPMGAIGGFSFIESDSVHGFIGSGGGFNVGDGNQLLLDEIDGVANIPIFASVTDAYPHPDGSNCTPCTFNSGSATLTDLGGIAGTGYGVNWGRWQIGWELTDSDGSVPHKEDMHFIYSPNRTPSTTVMELSGVYQFDFIGGTLPTDEFSIAGSYITSSITVDFDNMMVLDLFMNLSVNGKTVYAKQLHTLVPFENILNNNHGIPLVGSCSGGSCGANMDLRGDTSFNFVGSLADTLVSSWGLMEDSPSMFSTVSLVGVAALDKATSLPTSTFSFAPPTSILNLAYVESGGPGLHKGKQFNLNADIDTAIVVDTVGGAANVPIYTHFETFDSSNNLTCAHCEISSGTATLVDDGGLGGVNIGVNWGRWDGKWAGSGDQHEQIMPFGGLHYIYSPNQTPDSIVRSMSGSFSYALSGGTAPTDEMGNTGTLTGTNQIDIDFGSQTITNVTLEAVVNTRVITMNAAAAVSIEQVLNNQPVALNGLCTGADCGGSSAMVGQMGIDFVGPNAERLITSYGLSDDTTAPSVAISGTAAYDR